MSGIRAGRVVKPTLKCGRRAKKGPVLRMMAIMQDGNNSQEPVPKEFLDTGRTGRRNALPDILSAESEVTTADLPTRLQMLATTDANVPFNSETNSGESKTMADSAKTETDNNPDNPQAGPSKEPPKGEDEKEKKEKAS